MTTSYFFKSFSKSKAGKEKLESKSGLWYMSLHDDRGDMIRRIIMRIVISLRSLMITMTMTWGLWLVPA